MSYTKGLFRLLLATLSGSREKCNNAFFFLVSRFDNTPRFVIIISLFPGPHGTKERNLSYCGREMTTEPDPWFFVLCVLVKNPSILCP